MKGQYDSHLRYLQNYQQQHIESTVKLDQISSSERFPQWSIQETKELLMIRADLDQTFLETKRNKMLWGVIANKMKEMGYNRSHEQCKCKWKNLVTRYKGCEAMEPETTRQQFPFYSEIEAIFAGRMQRMLWSDVEGIGLKRKAVSALSLDDEDEDEDSEVLENYKANGTGKKKKSKSNNIGRDQSSNYNYLREILGDFMKKQVEMEMQWKEMLERREKERREKDMEWRRKMEALEKERMMIQRRWGEREEQRRMREEVRAEKRDALITILLNKITRDR